MAKQDRLKAAAAVLREFAMAYPTAYEEFPWGHCAIKVNERIFLTLFREGTSLGMSVKLPITGKHALTLPFASPTGYGLGKSGWVTAQFEAGAEVPTDMLTGWIDESFRAIAPKKLVATLDDAADGAAPDGEPLVKKTKRRKKRPPA